MIYDLAAFSAATSLRWCGRPLNSLRRDTSLNLLFLLFKTEQTRGACKSPLPLIESLHFCDAVSNHLPPSDQGWRLQTVPSYQGSYLERFHHSFHWPCPPIRTLFKVAFAVSFRITTIKKPWNLSMPGSSITSFVAVV